MKRRPRRARVCLNDSIRGRSRPRRLNPLVNLTGLKLDKKQSFRRALDIYSANAFLDFEDAMSVAHMERQGLSDNTSYDKDFDRVSGVARKEPTQ
jgi:predicted nucleic acid-binding protein